MQDWNLEFEQTLELNQNNLAIGASIWGRSADKPDYNRDHFNGVINDFTVYGSQLPFTEVAKMAGLDLFPDPENPYVENGVLHGTLKDEPLKASDYQNITAVQITSDWTSQVQFWKNCI